MILQIQVLKILIKTFLLISIFKNFSEKQLNYNSLDKNLCSICEEFPNQHLDFSGNNNINLENIDINSGSNPKNPVGNFAYNENKRNTNKNIIEIEDITVNRFLISKNNISNSETVDNNIILSNYERERNKNNITEFTLPKNVITELENPNLCVICFNSDTSKDPSVKFQCGHIFCLDCVKTYLEKNIENGKVKFILIRFLISIV